MFIFAAEKVDNIVFNRLRTLNFVKKTWAAKWLVAIPIMLVGCQAKNGNVRSNDDFVQVQDTAVILNKVNSEMSMQIERGVVLERVKDIFGIVRSTTMSSGGAYIGDMLDRAYCSKSWNKMLMDVRCKEKQTCTLFFEIEHWTMTTEPGFVSFDEFEVTQLSMDSLMKASVSFIALDSRSYTPARVDLVYEDGRWVIDNFYDLKYKMNVRESMKHFLRKEFI